MTKTKIEKYCEDNDVMVEICISPKLKKVYISKVKNMYMYSGTGNTVNEAIQDVVETFEKENKK